MFRVGPQDRQKGPENQKAIHLISQHPGRYKRTSKQGLPRQKRKRVIWRRTERRSHSLTWPCAPSTTPQSRLASASRLHHFPHSLQARGGGGGIPDSEKQVNHQHRRTDCRRPLYPTQPPAASASTKTRP